MKKVAVLMSTYNGKKYIKEQIESILNQKGVEVFLFVRDDGSTDENFLLMLEKYTQAANIIFGNNIGVGPSFLELITYANNQFDYYSFSDQDDVWLEDKLLRAIETIEQYDEPILYHSNQIVVDEQLNFIDFRRKDILSPSYLDILNNNKITGCTMVWNMSFQKTLLESTNKVNPNVLIVRIHDVFVSMVASVTAKIVYDPEPRILYRQHENNVVGVKNANLIKNWKKKITRPQLRRGRSLLAREILRHYKGSIRDSTVISNLEIVADYTKSLSKKIRLLFSKDIYMSAPESRLFYSIKVLLNLY